MALIGNQRKRTRRAPRGGTCECCGGGSFFNFEIGLLAADRNRARPVFRGDGVGFRVVFSR
jgi:hypothetical protein